MATSPDRKKQVATTKAKHGEDYYKKIGQRGGKNNTTKFNSSSGKLAIEARWKKYREEQSKNKEGKN